MTDKLLENLLDKLGQSAELEMEVIDKIKKSGYRLPYVLLQRYRHEKKWQRRDACVYYAIGYSKTDTDALQLGIEALLDKSKKVRYHACLLSFSLKQEAMKSLQKARSIVTDGETLENINAAIDAIENNNTNFFVDRKHAGKVFISLSK
jgi:phosphohistidine swiveling domain-containing protein